MPNIFIGGEHIGGYNDITEIFYNGELKRILNIGRIPNSLGKENDHGLGVHGDVISDFLNAIGYAPPANMSDIDDESEDIGAEAIAKKAKEDGMEYNIETGEFDKPIE